MRISVDGGQNIYRYYLYFYDLVYTCVKNSKERHFFLSFSINISFHGSKTVVWGLSILLHDPVVQAKESRSIVPGSRYASAIFELSKGWIAW